MKQTVGRGDRIIRGLVALGALIVAGVLGFSSIGGIVALVVAGVMVLTSASGLCPIYSVLGINTLQNDSSHSSAEQAHKVA